MGQTQSAEAAGAAPAADTEISADDWSQQVMQEYSKLQRARHPAQRSAVVPLSASGGPLVPPCAAEEFAVRPTLASIDANTQMEFAAALLDQLAFDACLKRLRC